MSLEAKVEYLKLGIALNVKTFCMVNMGITESILDIFFNISTYTLTATTNPICFIRNIN